jgi:hypothetical protein
MRQKSIFTVAVCAAALAGLSAGPAFAGEVKGPPGPFGVDGPNFTPVRDLDTSICAFSGLNDFIQGHTSFHVQSYGIDVSGKGDPADPHEFNPGNVDACRGGPPVD